MDVTLDVTIRDFHLKKFRVESKCKEPIITLRVRHISETTDTCEHSSNNIEESIYFQ